MISRIFVEYKISLNRSYLKPGWELAQSGGTVEYNDIIPGEG